MNWHGCFDNIYHTTTDRDQTGARRQTFMQWCWEHHRASVWWTHHSRTVWRCSRHLYSQTDCVGYTRQHLHKFRCNWGQPPRLQHQGQQIPRKHRFGCSTSADQQDKVVKESLYRGPRAIFTGWRFKVCAIFLTCAAMVHKYFPPPFTQRWPLRSESFVWVTFN